MNPFYLTWLVFFAFYCNSQCTPSEPILNTDCGRRIRCHTHPQIHQIDYIWTIHQFSSYEGFNTSEILSPKLHSPTTDEYEWYIKIRPNYIYEGNETIALYVCLSGGSKIREAIAHSNVSIINHKEETLLYNNTKYRYKAGLGWGWHGYCTKDDYFRHHLLQNDTLTLLINIKWCPQHYNNVSLEHKISSPSPTLTTTALLNHSEPFESLRENSKPVDVIFTINGSSYAAHKAILAAHSPIFAAMFRRNHTKSDKNKKLRIKVTRIDQEVLRAMLQYVYTGKCENLDNLADKLFVAAVKYGLEELRKTCEQTLCTALSAENAVKMLVFAEKHRANELKLKAAQFIANRSEPKLNTTG